MTLSALDIDGVIDAQYRGSSGKGELRQLAKLFGKQFGLDLEALLNARLGVRTTGFSREIQIGIGYIDKIPAAQFDPPIKDCHGNPITERTELGDAAIFFVDQFIQPGGTPRVRFASGLILQAKQANDTLQPKVVPIVPLPRTVNNSTLKELALLANWPTFDLYFTSKSQAALQKGYRLNDGSGRVQPHAWYIGAPPTMAEMWGFPRQVHWLAGPSELGASCQHSLGDLLHAILTGDGRLAGTEGVGKKFDFDARRLQVVQGGDDRLAHHASPPDWSDLCHQIMLACNRYDLPAHLFAGAGAKRGVGMALNAWPSDATIEQLKELYGWIKRRVSMFFGRRRYPVLVITSTARESSR